MKATLTRLLALAAVVLVVMTVEMSSFAANNGTTSLIKKSPADLEFIDMMMMHHQQGIEMARVALSKAHLPQLKDFAQKTIDDQQKDIGELERLRDKYYANQAKVDQMMMGGKKMTMADMRRMSEMDMSKLQAAATGTEFDNVFLDIFIKHHEMALQMSRSEISRGRRAEVKTLARQTIDKQTKDIAEMRTMKTKTGR